MIKIKEKKDLLNDLESPYTPSEYYLESARRDIYYSALIKDIVKNNRVSQVFKWIFFVVVCLAFIVVCAVGLLIIFNISKKSDISIEDVSVAITGFGSMLTAIIVLPQIIAKHLFPENSEEVRFGFIKENQKLDQSYLVNDVSESDYNEANSYEKG